MTKDNIKEQMSSRQAGRLAAGGFVLAFAAGAVTAAWAMYLYMHSDHALPGAGQTTVAVQGRSIPQPKSEPAMRPTAAAQPKQTPDFDPIAEAQRINQINRRNMQKGVHPTSPPTPMGGPPAPWRSGGPPPPGR